MNEKRIYNLMFLIEIGDFRIMCCFHLLLLLLPSYYYRNVNKNIVKHPRASHSMYVQVLSS